MKTTLDLADELFARRRLGLPRRVSLKEYVAAALREELGETSERSGDRL